MILRRTNTVTGAILLDELGADRMSEGRWRKVGQRVAWTGTDNLALSRAEASELAAKAVVSLKAGDTFTAESYRFELVKKEAV